MSTNTIDETKIVEVEEKFPKNTKKVEAIFKHHKIVYKATYIKEVFLGWRLQRIDVLANPLNEEQLHEEWIRSNMECHAKSAKDLIPEDVTPILITITYEKQLRKDKYYSLVRHYVYEPTNVREIISEIYYIYDKDKFNESNFINLIAKLDSILLTREVFDILNDRYTYTLETGLNDSSIQKILDEQSK